MSRHPRRSPAVGPGTVGEQVLGRLRRQTHDDQTAVGVAELAAKGAGPLAELWLTWPTLVAKLKENLLSLLSGAQGPAVAADGNE